MLKERTNEQTNEYVEDSVFFFRGLQKGLLWQPTDLFAMIVSIGLLENERIKFHDQRCLVDLSIKHS
jgi:hypothetical protein